MFPTVCTINFISGTQDTVIQIQEVIINHSNIAKDIPFSLLAAKQLVYYRYSAADLGLGKIGVEWLRALKISIKYKTFSI